MSGAPADPSAAPPGPVICSARDCRLPAVWALQWNNPKLHTPDRRKTWTACELHRTSLADFLGRRGFLREVEPLGQTAGAEPPAPSPATEPGD
ncbi:MAG TPA: hypothetical protein VK365_02410 [Nocardioidaceae bacterium]|nr:hypothetical protein [Nocardioidaceae bacterium]